MFNTLLFLLNYYAIFAIPALVILFLAIAVPRAIILDHREKRALEAKQKASLDHSFTYWKDEYFHQVTITEGWKEKAAHWEHGARELAKALEVELESHMELKSRLQEAEDVIRTLQETEPEDNGWAIVSTEREWTVE